MRTKIWVVGLLGVIGFLSPSGATPNSKEGWLSPIPDKPIVCLEHASSAKILDFLQKQFPEIRIRSRLRPGTSRGRGYRKDIEAFLEQLKLRDLTSKEEPNSLQVFCIVHSDLNEIKALLSTLVPDVAYAIDGRNIVAVGSSAALDQVRELVPELDRPLNQVLTDIRLVDLTPAAIRETGLTWIPEVVVRETRREFVNGVPTAKRATPTPASVRIGSFARSY